MNMQHGDQNGSEDKDRERRYGHCTFDIDPIAVDLTGVLKASVYRRGSPEDVLDTVLACDENWYVKVEWDLKGRLLHHLCGYFCVCVYLERIGPGADLKLDCDGDGRPCLQWIPIDPCGNGHYEVKCDGPKIEEDDCEACGTLYVVAVTLTSFDQCKDPGHIRAYCKGPTLMFYPPHKTTPPGPGSVSIADNAFNPSNLTISAGQIVTWTHSGASPHTVTSNPGPAGCTPPSAESFASATLNAGNTFQHVFNTPGTFPYHCEIHGCSMAGTVTVT